MLSTRIAPLDKQLDASRVLAGRGAGALAGESAASPRLQRQLDLRRMLPMSVTAPPLRTQAIAVRWDPSRLPLRGPHRRPVRLSGGDLGGASQVFGVERFVGASSLRAQASRRRYRLRTPSSNPATLAAWIVSWPIMPAPTTTAVSPNACGVRFDGVDSRPNGFDHGRVIERQSVGQPVAGYSAGTATYSAKAPLRR